MNEENLLEMAKEYNHVFEKLVSAPDDIVGMIAYCLYKQQKIETLNEMRESKGADLSEDEIKAFIAFSSTESQLDKYRLQGESILSEMISTIENDELVRFEERMLKEYKQNIKSVLPSKLESVALSMLAAFLFSVMVGVFFFLTDTSEKSVKENTEQIIQAVQKEIKSANDSIR